MSEKSWKPPDGKEQVLRPALVNSMAEVEAEADVAEVAVHYH